MGATLGCGWDISSWQVVCCCISLWLKVLTKILLNVDITWTESVILWNLFQNGIAHNAQRFILFPSISRYNWNANLYQLTLHKTLVMPVFPVCLFDSVLYTSNTRTAQIFRGQFCVYISKRVSMGSSTVCLQSLPWIGPYVISNTDQ